MTTSQVPETGIPVWCVGGLLGLITLGSEGNKQAVETFARLFTATREGRFMNELEQIALETSRVQREQERS